MSDRYAVVCNVTDDTKVVRSGAKAYVGYIPGDGPFGSLCITVQSRGGRLIRKWEPVKRLSNFRIKTIPPEHPATRWDKETDNAMYVTLHDSREEAQRVINRIAPARPGAAPPTEAPTGEP